MEIPYEEKLIIHYSSDLSYLCSKIGEVSFWIFFLFVIYKCKS